MTNMISINPQATEVYLQKQN